MPSKVLIKNKVRIFQNYFFRKLDEKHNHYPVIESAKVIAE